MSQIIENPRVADFLLSEANGTLSVENAILIMGQNLDAGTVLGKITASGKYTQLAVGASDGSQIAAGILRGNINATAADTACVVVVREAEAKAPGLIWPAGITGPQTTTAVGQLANANILVR